MINGFFVKFAGLGQSRGRGGGRAGGGGGGGLREYSIASLTLWVISGIFLNRKRKSVCSALHSLFFVVLF